MTGKKRKQRSKAEQCNKQVVLHICNEQKRRAIEQKRRAIEQRNLRGQK